MVKCGFFFFLSVIFPGAAAYIEGMFCTEVRSMEIDVDDFIFGDCDPGPSER